MLKANPDQFRVRPEPPPAAAEAFGPAADPCPFDHPQAVARRRGAVCEVRVGQTGALTGRPYEPARDHPDDLVSRLPELGVRRFDWRKVPVPAYAHYLRFLATGLARHLKAMDKETF